MRSMQFDSVCMIKFSAGYLTGRRKRGKTGKIVGEFFLLKLIVKVKTETRENNIVLPENSAGTRVQLYASKRAKSNQPKDILNSINLSA